MSIDYNELLEKVKSDKRVKNQTQFGLGGDLDALSKDREDYVPMPSWWEESYGIAGLPFGRWVQISGKPDSGKTTLCLTAIRSAIENDIIPIYVETEDKTSPDDLLEAGIDPEKVFSIRTNCTEEVYNNIAVTLDNIYELDPKAKVFLAIDSYGNTTSLRDTEIDLEKGGKVGGHAATNRIGLSQISAKMKRQEIATLIVNYSYANLGSVGETNAGGRALEFFCGLIINASRKKNLEKQVKGVKVKCGVEVVWKTTKNHFVKTQKDEDGNAKLFPKEVCYTITSEGIKPI